MLCNLKSVMLEGEGTGDGHPRRKLVDEGEVPPKPKKSNAKPPRSQAVIRRANMLLRSDWEIISVMFRTEGKKKNIKETMRRKN